LVSARSGRTGTVALGLLDVDGATVELMAVKLVHDCIGILNGHHVDEAEATRVSAVWVANNGSVLNFAMLSEEVAKLIVPE
jgi:hypothetical protein